MQKTLPWIIVAAGAALRLFDFYGWSLSNDELSALARLRFSSFSDLIESGVKPDMHPAGVQVFLYLWTKIFGTGEAAVRLPFVLAGTAAVYLVYLTGRNLLNTHAGLAAAALVAVLEYPVMYSQLARPYGMGLFFVLLSAYFWSRLFRHRLAGKDEHPLPRWPDFLGFALAVTACMYTHYFAMLEAGLLCLGGLALCTRRQLGNYALAGLLIGVLYLPHTAILRHHLATGGLGGEGGWLGPPDASFFGKYLGYAFNQSGVLLAIATAFALLSVAAWIRKRHAAPLFLAAFFVIPLLTGYFYSVYVNPVLQYSVLIFAFPFLVLFIFSFLPGKAAPLYPVPLTLFLLLFGGWSTAIDNRYYATQHFAVFEELALKTIEWNNQYGAHNITRTANVHSPYYLEYYFNRYRQPIPFALYKCNDYDQAGSMAKAVAAARTPFFMHAWSNIYDLPETEAMIRYRYPFVAGDSAFFNSGITLFSADSAFYRPENVLYDSTHDYESVPLIGKPAHDSTHAAWGGYSIRIDESAEYSPGHEITGLVTDKPFTAFVSASVFTAGTAPEAKLVFSIESHTESLLWYGREMKPFFIHGNTWNTVFAAVRFNRPLRGDEIIKAYVWNDKKEVFNMDNLKLLIISK